MVRGDPQSHQNIVRICAPPFNQVWAHLPMESLDWSFPWCTTILAVDSIVHFSTDSLDLIRVFIDLNHSLFKLNFKPSITEMNG